MTVYCDAAILIYFLEHTGPLQVLAADRFAALHVAADEIAVSELVRLECRVKPMRLRNFAALAVFDRFFAMADVRLVAMNRSVFESATAIRAQFGYTLGDSLHLAAAIVGGCSLFLTNDARLANFNGMAVEVLQ